MADKVQIQKTIGTNPESDIRISSKYVSDEHAILVKKNERVYIEDFNSTFGTHINGKEIKKLSELLPGDRVKLGTQLFHWEDYLDDSKQETNPIFLKDLFSPVGLINWEDYKIILILTLGAAIIIPLGIPSILIFIEYQMNRRSASELHLSPFIEPLVIIVTIITSYIFLNLTQKSLRQKFTRTKH